MKMNARKLDIALKATAEYKKYTGCHVAIREAKVLNVLYPDVIEPLTDTDYFFGNSVMVKGRSFYEGFDSLVTCHPYAFSQIGFGIHGEQLNEFDTLKEMYPERAQEIDDLVAFWIKEATFVKMREEAPTVVRQYLYPRGEENAHRKWGYVRTLPPRPLGAGIMSGSYDSRIAGLAPNYTDLLKLGLTGLKDKIESLKQKNTESEDYYNASIMCVDILIKTCERFRVEAQVLADNATDSVKKLRLQRIADTLYKLQHSKPDTFYEAIQLFLVYNMLSGAQDYGRLDVVFGDFLVNDLNNGILTKESAEEVMDYFWKTFSVISNVYNSRVLIGGKGRLNEENADVFALYAIEATIRGHEIRPVLTLRWYDGQNPLLFDKALEAISQGCIYPTLYNDDRNVEGCMQSMNLPYEDALKYQPLGCGEFNLSECGTGSPNTTMRFLKILEVTLHNGLDGVDGYPLGLKTGELSEFTTYEKLEEAFFEQIKDCIRRDLELHKWYKERTGKDYCAVMQSLLTDDCLARGKAIFHGGIRYFGANIEGFGVTNVANSLAAIKKLVYENNEYTLEQLVHILDVDFEGFEDDRKRFLSMPKYGNNDPYVDEIKLRVETFINNYSHKLCEETEGLTWYTVASVNPGGITIGTTIGASADGRKKATAQAVGNSSHAGTDVNGLTAMLSSAALYTDNRNGGYVTNINVSRKTMVEQREKIKSIFLTYFKMGGLQLNINCFSKGDLEKALENPEKYQNLIVRVSGYSAKFVDLPPMEQKQIMERTLF